MVLLRLPFGDDITQPLPCTLRMVHRTDEIPSLTQPNGTGFSSQSRDFTNRISTLPLGPPPAPPPPQNHSYSEPATLGVQVNPWSVPGVRRVMATSLQHSRSRSEPPPLQWLEDEFITCLTAQLTAHLAKLAGVKSEFLKRHSSAMFVLGALEHCFFKCIPACLRSWLC